MATIKELDQNDTREYVPVAQLGEKPEYADVSASGKAALLDAPRHLGQFWAPISILRAHKASEVYGYELLAPVWFLRENGVAY